MHGAGPTNQSARSGLNHHQKPYSKNGRLTRIVNSLLIWAEGPYCIMGAKRLQGGVRCFVRDV